MRATSPHSLSRNGLIVMVSFVAMNKTPPFLLRPQRM
jgi:hypothetical protein